MDLPGGALIVVALRERDVLAVRRHPSTAGEEIAVLVGDLLRDERGAAVVRDADEAVAVAGSVVRDVDVLSRRRDGQPRLVRPRRRHADGSVHVRPWSVDLRDRHAGLEPLEPRREDRARAHRPRSAGRTARAGSPGRRRGTGRVPTSGRRRRRRAGRSTGSGKQGSGPVRCIGSRGCRHTAPIGSAAIAGSQSSAPTFHTRSVVQPGFGIGRAGPVRPFVPASRAASTASRRAFVCSDASRSSSARVWLSPSWSLSLLAALGLARVRGADRGRRRAVAGRRRPRRPRRSRARRGWR